MTCKGNHINTEAHVLTGAFNSDGSFSLQEVNVLQDSHSEGERQSPEYGL